MKRPGFFLIALFIPIIFYTQNFYISNNDCPPVLWVNAEILEGDKVIISWDVPCDTCNPLFYYVDGIDFSLCGCYNPPFDTTITVLAATSNLQYLHHTGGLGHTAYGIRAKYDSCNSDRTNSNVLYYDSTWYNQTFQLLVNVSLEDGGNPEGANVIVNGANCYYEDSTYNKQADGEGVAHFEAIMKGNYNIIVSKPGYHTAVVEDFCLKQDSTVNIELKIYYVDIAEKNESNNIAIYPNPTTNQLNIQSQEIIEQITIINHLGQTVLVHHINNKQSTINTSALEAGIYIVRVKTKNGVVNKRIVISE